MPREPVAPERWIVDAREDGVTVLYLQGAWRLPNLSAVTAEIRGLRLSADRPCVLEVKVDPEMPPLPPHITVEQAKKMARAMVKGDPERVGVMEKSLLGKLMELKESLPGRG